MPAILSRRRRIFVCSPTACRYIRLELQTEVHWGKEHWPGDEIPALPATATPAAWNVGKVEVYGFTGPQALRKENAVVLERDAAPPLALAANDLSYYLGELSGQPHPVIAPEEAAQYPGTLYRIVNLKPLAPTYEEMEANQQAGKFPTESMSSAMAAKCSSGHGRIAVCCGASGNFWNGRACAGSIPMRTAISCQPARE